MNHCVVLDTNVLISALIFGGIPRQLLDMCLRRDMAGVTSDILLAEFSDVVTKKFHFDPGMTAKIKQKLVRKYLVVHPKRTINVLADQPDNRVLEAAATGQCNSIITGDKDLLTLKQFESIVILTPRDFMTLIVS